MTSESALETAAGDTGLDAAASLTTSLVVIVLVLSAVATAQLASADNR